VAVPDGAWAIRDRLERDGIAFVDDSVLPSGGMPEWYQNTWHAPWYVFEHWGRWFDIRGYVPGGSLGVHDLVLLERRPHGAPARVPVAARPSLPVGQSPSARVSSALASARALRARDTLAHARLRAARSLAKRFVLRAIRPYSAHEDRFDDAVATSVDELTRLATDSASRLAEVERRLDAAGIERRRDSGELGRHRDSAS
jgi:hypothetical protein